MLKYYLVALLLSSFILSAQEFDKKTENTDISVNRKGQLFFKLGSEFRVTPLPFDTSDPDFRTNFSNVDQLHSGPAFSYGLEFFINRNFSIGLDHSLRYDTVLYDFNQLGENFVANKSQKELLHGFHLYFTKYFKLSSKGGEIFIRAGLSSFNGGSEFLFVEPIGEDENGEPLLFLQSQNSFANFGTNFAVGYRKNRVSIQLGVYLSNGSTFYRRNFRIVTPFIKFTYSLGKL